ncbi:MAG: EMC3/TMCO1 family protein [Candidatus Nanohaloarchaea archaeon]
MAGTLAAFVTTLYSFYSTVFQPVLALGPYISLGIFSAGLAAAFSIIYWYFLDIEKQNELKEKINKYQDKMKQARKDGKAEDASDHMQKTMELNQKMMLLNFKPMIGTMVFVALFFPWLGATYAPAVPLQNGNATYTGEFTFANSSVPVNVDNTTGTPQIKVGGKEVAVGETVKVHGIEWQVTRIGESKSGIFSIHEGKVLKLNAEFIELPFSIPFAGNELNWLGFYIVLAMPLTYIFRKMLGVT